MNSLQESPDWNPVLDKHPQYPNIIMGFGFSGMSNGYVAVIIIGGVGIDLRA